MKWTPATADASKRILILYYSSHPVCGIGAWIDTFLRVMRPLGWEVIVGLAWGRRHNDPRGIEAAHPDWATIWMDGRTGTTEGRVRAIEKTIRHVQPRIVILKNLMDGFEAVRRARVRGCDFRLVAVNHGSWPQHAAAMVANQDALDAAVSVNALSAFALRGPENGMSPQRVFHVPNAVPAPLAPRPSREDGAPLRLGYAGRIATDKHADQLVPFLQRLAVLVPDVALWVAGRGDLAPTLQRELAPWGGRVRFFGQLSRADLYQRFYPYVDVFLSFSPAEGWPLAIGEAMANGAVPVVARYKGLAQENVLIEGRNCLVFPVDDTGAAAERVAKLDADRHLLGLLAADAAQTIASEFLEDSFARRWSKALADVLALPPLPHPRQTARLKGRWGLRESWIEAARRLLRRRVPHATAAEEWPDYRLADSGLAERISAKMDSIESDRPETAP